MDTAPPHCGPACAPKQKRNHPCRTAARPDRPQPKPHARPKRPGRPAYAPKNRRALFPPPPPRSCTPHPRLHAPVPHAVHPAPWMPDSSRDILFRRPGYHTKGPSPQKSPALRPEGFAPIYPPNGPYPHCDNVPARRSGSSGCSGRCPWPAAFSPHGPSVPKPSRTVLRTPLQPPAQLQGRTRRRR